MKTIDCRNMSCPLPVVTVKRAMEDAPGEGFRVLLDGGAPVENVTRFAVNRGYAVKEETVEGGCVLEIGGGGIPCDIEGLTEQGGPRVMLVASDRLGDGPDEL